MVQYGLQVFKISLLVDKVLFFVLAKLSALREDANVNNNPTLGSSK